MAPADIRCKCGAARRHPIWHPAGGGASPLPLTSEGTTEILPVGARERTLAKDRSPARHARPVDPENPYPRAQSWLGDLKPHPTNLPRGSRSESRIPVSSAPSARAARRRGIGDDGVRKQPAGASLQADCRGPSAAVRRNGELGAVCALDQADPSGRLDFEREVGGRLRMRSSSPFSLR